MDRDDWMNGDKKRLHDIVLFSLLCLCALLLMGRIAYLFLADSTRFPIKTVKISATYQHIPRQQIADILTDYADSSFFSLPIKRLHEQLSSLNWTEKVSIKRVWPDTLNIILIEKSPFALWNNHLMTATGVLFKQMDASLDGKLPRLFGPDNQQSEVLQIYQKLSKLLQTYGLSIKSLHLRDNQALDLTLTNRVKLKLGKQYIEQKLIRFCKAYQSGLIEKPEEISSVDLCYAHGMAVNWKQQTGR